MMARSPGNMEIKHLSLETNSEEDIEVAKRGVMGFRNRLSLVVRHRFFKWLVRGIGVLAVFGLILILTVVWPAKKTVDSTMDAVNEARAAWFAFKQQNLGVAQEKLKATEEKLLETQRNFGALKWLSSLPLVGSYISDVDHGIKAGLAGVEAGELAIEALEPYADLLGFEGQGGFWVGTAEERIEKAVGTIDKLAPALDGVLAQLQVVRKEVDFIDPNRYPFTLNGRNLKEQIAQGQAFLDENVELLVQAAPLVKNAGKLLGMKEPAYYLVIFQNDKELRSTGGFITAYAIFRVEKGKVIPEISEDIYNLDKRVRHKVKPPEVLRKYLNVYTWNIRDSNTSPDFVSSMKNFMSMYETTGEGRSFTGIIALDTEFVVDLMKPLEEFGPIPAYGTHFSTTFVEACNCPQVVYELERYADLRVGEVRENRKDIIAVLMKALIDRALSSPRQTLEKLVQATLHNLEEKHLLIYLSDEGLQAGVEKLGWAGRIEKTASDYFHLNENNLGGAKSNLFVEETMEQVIEIKAEGTVEKTVRVTYKNPEPQSVGCNLEAKNGLCLNGILRNWVRFYVPLGSELIGVTGSEEEIKIYEDLGKTVFEGFLQVRPAFGGQAGFSQIVVKYRLPKKVLPGDKYELLIQKQPGSKNFPVKIKYHDEVIEEFELDKNVVVNFTT